MTTAGFGERIREERERAGLTQGNLAKLVGVSIRTIGNWERGEAAPQSSLTRLRDILPGLREDNTVVPFRAAENPVLAAIDADPYLLPEAKAHFRNQYELLLRVERPDSDRLPYAAHGRPTEPVSPEREAELEKIARDAAKRNKHAPRNDK